MVVTDYGVRGLHLAYDLLDPWAALILVDAVPDRGTPGTVHVFETSHEFLSMKVGFDAHAMDPAAVFASLNALGGTAPPTVVIGCEVGTVEEGIGLSPRVAAAVPVAVEAVGATVTELRTRTAAGRG